MCFLLSVRKTTPIINRGKEEQKSENQAIQETSAKEFEKPAKVKLLVQRGVNLVCG